MAAPALLLCAAFLITGCFNSVITQIIYNYAPINPKSMVLVLCAYMGYSLRVFLPDDKETKNKKVDEEGGKAKKKKRAKEKDVVAQSKLVYLYMFAQVVAEVIAAQLSTISFALIGSGLHQVLYSSVIIFTALVSVFILHKKIYNTQWVALVLLTAGLMLSAGRVNASEVPIEGILNLFMSTFIYSVTSPLSEVVMQKYDFPSSKYPSFLRQPRFLSTTCRYSMYCGFYGSALIGIYVLVVTTAHWQEWVMEPIRQSSGQAGMLAVGFLLFILIVGSVSTGVLYALQAVSMFSLSAVLFCDATHPNQCFSMTKALGTVVVSCGVALYSIGGKHDKLKS